MSHENLRSEPVDAVPGFTIRRLTAPARDTSGHLWPVGTEFRPETIGADNIGRKVVTRQVVYIDGKRVEFVSQSA